MEGARREILRGRKRWHRSSKSCKRSASTCAISWDSLKIKRRKRQRPNPPRIEINIAGTVDSEERVRDLVERIGTILSGS